MHRATALGSRALSRPVTLTASRTTWLNVALISLTIGLDLVMLPWFGLRVELSSIAVPLATVVILSAAALWYIHRGETAFVLALGSLVQIVVLASAYAVLMYCCGAIGMPMRDAALESFDKACGVDIGGLVRWTDSHPTIKSILSFSYDTVMLQTGLALIVLGLRKDAARLQGFVFVFITTVLVSILGLALFPAIGPYEANGYSPTPYQQAFITDLLALREGTFTTLRVDELEGLVTCPSFHTVWAVLLMWAFWNVPWLRWPAVVLNALIVFSTVALGWHFFADVVLGLAIAGVGLWAWHKIQPRLFLTDGTPRTWSWSWSRPGNRSGRQPASRQPKVLGCLVVAMLTMPAATATAEPAAVNPAASAAVEPDFAREVWPILSTRCVGCHNETVPEGGLNLMTRDDLLIGGSRGSSIDRHLPDQSVLSQLIQQDAHPRMPFEQDPLTQPQIDTLVRWVRAGAPYGDVSQSAVILLQGEQQLQSSLATLRSVAFAPIASPMGISRVVPVWPITLGLPLIVVMAVWHRRRVSDDPTAKPFSLGFWAGGCACVFGVLLVKHYRDQLDPVSLRGVHHQVHLMFGNPPRPVNMDDTPSLHRVYYRGNDERSPAMFNNGNYRTSTFHVDLVDQHGRALNLGDRIDADTQVCLQWRIDRAPFTPDVLFDADLMGRVYLTTQPDIDAACHAADKMFLTVDEPGQTWTARFPLTNVQEGLTTHNVYVWHTMPADVGEPLPKLHYAAEVRLNLCNGVLSDGSDAWFGGMRFTQPFISFRIPPDQWLSSHPIPELPAPNLQTPEMLGVDEHVSLAN